jgi:hypothetical protein
MIRIQVPEKSGVKGAADRHWRFFVLVGSIWGAAAVIVAAVKGVL